MNKTFFTMLLILSAALAAHAADTGTSKVSIEFIEFMPNDILKENVPIEMVFLLRNTGKEPINPFADVTISGKVYSKDFSVKGIAYDDIVNPPRGDNNMSVTEKSNAVLTVIDKKYKVYNLWPDDKTGRLRLYIGLLKKGAYLMKLNIDAVNVARKELVSSEEFKMDLYVR